MKAEDFFVLKYPRDKVKLENSKEQKSQKTGLRKYLDSDRILGALTTTSYLVLRRSESIQSGDIIRVDFNPSRFEFKTTLSESFLGLNTITVSPSEIGAQIVIREASFGARMMPFLIGAGFCLLALVCMTSLDRLAKIKGYRGESAQEDNDAP